MFACDKLNLDILDKKGGCPKKPAKDINIKQERMFRFVGTPCEIMNICLFVNFLLTDTITTDQQLTPKPASSLSLNEMNNWFDTVRIKTDCSRLV